MDGEIQLRNYDEFRRKAKALSHIRVTRDGDYSHHFVIISITSTSTAPFPFRVRVRVLVFSATFNSISAITWQSVLLGEKTGVPGENNRPVAIN
jgi:hypothetical protein